MSPALLEFFIRIHRRQIAPLGVFFCNPQINDKD